MTMPALNLDPVLVAAFPHCGIHVGGGVKMEEDGYNWLRHYDVEVRWNPVTHVFKITGWQYKKEYVEYGGRLLEEAEVERFLESDLVWKKPWPWSKTRKPYLEAGSNRLKEKVLRTYITTTLTISSRSIEMNHQPKTPGNG